MATKYWVSGASNDWATTANWSGGSIPLITDDIVFDPAFGTASVLTNVDRTGDGAGSPWATGRTLAVRQGFPGTIGALGAPLKMNFNGILKHYGAGGAFHFENAHATGVLEATIAPSSRASEACVLDGKFIDITHHAGRLTLDASMILTGRLRMLHDPKFGATPLLVTGTGATVSGALLIVLDGEAQVGVAMPVIVQSGGLVIHSAGTVPVVYQTGGEYRPTAGIVTAHHIYGASAQFDGASGAAWTVTAMYAGKDALIDLRNGFGAKPATLKNFGARILEDSGTT